MNFRDVAVKNFHANIRKYLSYFLCSSFSVMIFFMYSTIFFNDKLKNSDQVSKGSIDVLSVPLVALIIFSIFFISYAHASFIKSRQQEFGLFMSLGMSIKQIVRIIVIENVLVGIASMLVGIVSGTVFSRLFFVIALKVLQVNGIEFGIPYKSFLFTIGIFAAVFLLAILTSIITAYRFQPVQLLKSRKLSLRNKVSNPMFAILGIGLMVASMIFLCIKFASKDGMDSSYLMISIGICFSGLYIAISQLGGLLINISKKRKTFYYKNIRLITGLDYRFKQTKKIIFTTTIMVMITTFYCGTAFYFLSSAEKAAVQNNPFHAAFIQLSDKNNIPEVQLNKLLSTGETELTEHKVLEVLSLREFYNNVEGSQRTIISVDRLNEIVGSTLKVNQGKFILLNQIPKESDSMANQFNAHDVCLRVGSVTATLKFQQEVNKVYLNRLETMWFDIIIVNNNDYEAMKSKAHISNLANIHLLNFKDWKETNLIVSRLKKEFKTYNQNSPKSQFFTKLDSTEEEFFSIVSRIGNYISEKQSCSILLFTSGFLGLFFFIAASVILSFRLLSEIDEEKAKYKQLANIGIRDKEVRKTINQELGIIFFIPIILGAGLSLIYIYAFTRDGGQNNAPLLYNLLVSLIYLGFQIGYYFITRKVYCDKIIESLII